MSSKKKFKMKDSKTLTKAIIQTETWEAKYQIKTKTSKQTNYFLTFSDILTLCIAWKILCIINTCGWQTLLKHLCNGLSNHLSMSTPSTKLCFLRRYCNPKKKKTTTCRDLYKTLTRLFSCARLTSTQFNCLQITNINSDPEEQTQTTSNNKYQEKDQQLSIPKLFRFLSF